MLSVNFHFANPGEMNNDKTVWLIYVLEKNIIVAHSRSKGFNRYAIEQMALWQFSLRFHIKARHFSALEYS